MDKITQGMSIILLGMSEKYGLDLRDDNFTGTPNRVMKMFDELFSGMQNTEEQIKEILDSSFPSDYNQMVMLKNVETFSMCPHHFLPVHYFISMAYIPSKTGKVLGISKLARLAEILSRRPVLQEQLTEDITKYLMEIKGSEGAACIVKGTHYCMVMRGIKKANAATITSSLKGAFYDDSTARQEFIELVNSEK